MTCFLRLCLCLFFVCLTVPVPKPCAASEPFYLYAAAGTKKPLDAIIAKFTKETGIKIYPNYGPAGGLYAQIKAGQPCDLYLSADWLYIEKLEQDNQLVYSNKFLSDTVVLIVSETGRKRITSLRDLTQEGLSIAIADKRAPVGVYSERGLKSMGIFDAVLPNIKTRPSTVNQVAIVVKQDNVDAGLTFSSVAKLYGLDAIDAFAPEDTGEILFGFGVLKTAQQDVARQFIEYARAHSKEFEQYGWKLCP